MNHFVSINRNALRAIAQTSNRLRQFNLFSTLQKDYQENMRKAKRETYDSASLSDTTSDEEIQVYLLYIPYLFQKGKLHNLKV